MSSSEISPRHVRQDMVTSAISFLNDPKVQQSSVSQRVSFLESKGLSPDEIDEALRQTGASGAITAGVAAQAGPSHSVYANSSGGGAGQPVYYGNGGMYAQPMHPAQTHHDRDWRDWFIMAVVSGTVGYGIIQLARKYLFPHLQPPNQTILEEDRDALTAKYDEVAAQLSALDAETKAVKAGIEEQKESIEKSIKDVEETITMLRQSDKKRSEEMENVKSEVDGMKSSLATMFEKTKEAQTASLSELQSELKSLKSLLVSRNATSAAASSNTPRPYSPFNSNANGGNAGVDASNGSSSPSFATSKPSIPAWQLASTNDSASSPPLKEAVVAASDSKTTEGYNVESATTS